MKKILLLLFLVAAISSRAQFPNTATTGNSSTLQRATGAYGSMMGYVFAGSYGDTTAANLSFIKNITGIVIRVVNDLWIRNSTATEWIKIGSGGTGSFDTTTIYANLALKLNITDTAGHWVTHFYKKPSTDSIFYVVGGVAHFAYKDSIGGGSPLPSLSQYHLYVGDGSSAPVDAGANLTYDGTKMVIGDPLSVNTSKLEIKGDGVLGHLGSIQIARTGLSVTNEAFTLSNPGIGGLYLYSENSLVLNATTGVYKITTSPVAYSSGDYSVLVRNSSTGNIEIDTTSNRDTYIVYVDVNGNDATGKLGRSNRPFKTIHAALAAGTGVSYLTVKIGLGTFDSPPQSDSRSDVAFIGSGLPRFDNYKPTVTGFDTVTQTLPTKLVGGTILRGTIWFADKEHIHLENFGCDVGSDWVTNVNGGTAVDGILIAQNYTAGGPDGSHPLQTDYPPSFNTIIKNIVILGNYSGSQHGLLVENKADAIVENVTSACFIYCVVFKTHGCTANNIVALSPRDAGIYFKSSYYSYFTGGNFTNMRVDGLRSDCTGDGFFIGGELNVATIKNIVLTGFSVTRCKNGIRFINAPGATSTVENCIFSNGVIDNNSGTGITTDAAPVKNSNFSNIIASHNGGAGFIITIGDYNSLSGLRAISNVGVGFYLSATTRMDVSDIFSNNNASTSIIYGSNIYTMGVTSLSGAITGSSTAR